MASPTPPPCGSAAVNAFSIIHHSVNWRKIFCNKKRKTVSTKVGIFVGVNLCLTLNHLHRWPGRPGLVIKEGEI